jgi:hypothetical protein
LFKELTSMARTLSRSRPSHCRLAARPRIEALEERNLLSGAFWAGYAKDAQHTAISSAPSQPLAAIHWQTPVDLQPQYSGGELLIHYGSPVITLANTVIVPVKTGAFDGFELQAHDGANGNLKWTLTTDYILPPHDWTPSYSPTLTPDGRLYFAGAGGTIFVVDTPDANGTPAVKRLAFYGLAHYLNHQAAFDNNVFINTPITSDSAGDIFFGFQVTGANPLHLVGGIARIDAQGKGTWVAASTAAGDSSIAKVVHNCAPALSNNEKTLYVAVSNGAGFGFATGYLVALDSQTLAPLAHVQLFDPQSGALAILPEQGSASPMVGPDGDVYFGVLEDPFPDHNDRGWLLHFSADLSQQKITGSFGWDDTASVVPSFMVPSYHGTSSYLVMTKYNNYAGLGGNGANRLAVLDPNAVMPDPYLGNPVMKNVLTVLGPTPDPNFIHFFPHAVREWCINSAAIDPFTSSILVNSEDGHMYRWDLISNKLTQVITLTSGIAEAYTPTIVGPDGTVYAINNAVLFALGRPQSTGPDAATPIRAPSSAVASNPHDFDSAGALGITALDAARTLSGLTDRVQVSPYAPAVTGTLEVAGTALFAEAQVTPERLGDQAEVARTQTEGVRDGAIPPAVDHLFASDSLFGTPS